MLVFRVLLFLVPTFLAVKGNEYTVYWAEPRNCGYEGYSPGGNVTEVGKIKAPVAKMAKRGFSSVMGPVSQASTLAMHSWNTVKAVVGAFKTVAPALGPALGVFGAVTGIFTSLTKPKPEDILNAANAAIADLTNDVNKKIGKMEGYVNAQVVRIQKNLITRSYDAGWVLWRNCAKEASFDWSQECQREAYATLVADRGKYAIFGAELKAAAKLKNIQVREIEAYLIAYRNYANLILMMLKPLIETYGNDSSTVGQRAFTRYKNDMKEEATYYVWYAKAAVEAVVKYHEGSDPKGAGNCLSSITCGRLNQYDEGDIIPVHTGDQTECSCVMDDGTKQTCTLKVFIRADGKYPSGYGTYNYGCTNKDCQAEKYTYARLWPYAHDYEKKDVEIVKAYWQKEVLDFVPVWEEVIKYAEDAKSNVVRADVPGSGDGEESDDDREPIQKFSSRYYARMKKAREEVLKEKEKAELLGEGESAIDKLKNEVEARIKEKKGKGKKTNKKQDKGKN